MNAYTLYIALAIAVMFGVVVEHKFTVYNAAVLGAVND